MTVRSKVTKSIVGALLGLLVLAAPMAQADEKARANALASAIESEGFEITQKGVRPGIVKVAGQRGSEVVRVKAQSFTTLPNMTSGIVGLLKQARQENPDATRRKVKLAGAEAAYLSFGGKNRGTTLLFSTKTQAVTFVWIGTPKRQEYQALATKLAGALGGSVGGSAKAGLSGRLGGALSGGAGGAGNADAEDAPVLSVPGGAAGPALDSAGPASVSTPQTQTSGAGFYVSEDLILTSGFVAPQAKTVRLTDSNQRSFSGEVIGRFNEGGIALTLIKTERAGVALPFAKPQSDQAVFPFSSSDERSGKTKATLERSSEGAFVISGASLGDAHTGGPLVDGEGRVIGLLFTRTTADVAQPCAVPAATIQAWLAKSGLELELENPSPSTELYTAKKVQRSVVRVQAR